MKTSKTVIFFFLCFWSCFILSRAPGVPELPWWPLKTKGAWHPCVQPFNCPTKCILVLLKNHSGSHQMFSASNKITGFSKTVR